MFNFFDFFKRIAQLQMGLWKKKSAILLHLTINGQKCIQFTYRVTILVYNIFFFLCFRSNQTKQTNEKIYNNIIKIHRKSNEHFMNAFDCFCPRWMKVIKISMGKSPTMWSEREQTEKKMTKVELLSLTIKCHFVKCVRA